MQKSDSKTIQDAQGSIDLKSTQLPARRAFKLLTRLGKLLSRSLVDVKKINHKDPESLVRALMSLFDSLEPEEADTLSLQILEGTLAVVGGRAVTLSNGDAIDTVFSGRLLAMFKAMVFALEVNFRDFFHELASSVPAPAPAAAENPASP